MGNQDGLWPDSGRRCQIDADNNATGDGGRVGLHRVVGAYFSGEDWVKRSMVPSATLNQRDWVLRYGSHEA